MQDRFSSQNKPQSIKFRSQQLDIIKAAAIFFVVAFHYFPGELNWHLQVMPAGWFQQYWNDLSAFTPIHILQFLVSYLYVGVNLFVIASGFGLYLSHLKSSKPFDWKEFFVKRIWRLMPAAIFSVIALFFVRGIFLGQWIISNFYVNFLPFLGGLNLFSNDWFFPPINGVTWFFGLLIQLYLFFPLLIWLYEKIGEKKFLILLLGISVLFRSLYYIFWKDAVSDLSYGLSIGRLFEFGFGMVLAKKFFEKKPLSPLWMLGIICGLGYFWWWSFPFADSLFGVGIFTLVWFLAKKLPVWSGWGKIALQSYLIFLLHQPFIWILQHWGFHQERSLLGFIVLVVFFGFSYWLAKISQWILDWIDQVCAKIFAAYRARKMTQ